MTVNIENIPQELRQIPQWVGWKYGRARADGKRPKLPIDPHTGRAAKSDNPATWGGFATATAAVTRWALEGVGFEFADGGGYTGIDFDDCIVGGELTPDAAAMVRALNSYTEISPSGLGVKVWVKGAKPAGAKCRCDTVSGCKQIEIYDVGRFFTVTGRQWPGTPGTVEARQGELEVLCRLLWPGRGTVGKICTPSPGVSQLGGSVERCRRYLERTPDAISGEGGHNRTFAAACACYRFGLSDDDAAAALAWFNAAKCRPAWTEGELRHKLADAKETVEAAGEFGAMLQSSRPAKGKRPWHNDLPEWIRTLERPRLRPYQTAILQAIANRCNAKPIDSHGSLGGAIIGYDELAKITGMVRRTAFGHVRTLMGMGLLVRTEKGGIDFQTGEIRANVYAIPGAEGVKVGRGAKLTPPHTPTLAYVGCNSCQPSAPAPIPATGTHVTVSVLPSAGEVTK